MDTRLIVAALAVAGALLIYTLVLPGFAGPSGPQMTVRDAHAKAAAGEIVLVDIRTPEEWRETGVPATAHAITMHQDGRVLVAKLKAATAGDTSRPLALICRTGNRSSHLQAELAKAGFTNVIDVGEGMAGSRHGPGWLKAGLPRRTGAAVSMPPQITQRTEAR